MTNERMVDLHVEHNEGFAYSQWMLSPDCKEDTRMLAQPSVEEEQTVI